MATVHTFGAAPAVGGAAELQPGEQLLVVVDSVNMVIASGVPWHFSRLLRIRSVCSVTNIKAE